MVGTRDEQADAVGAVAGADRANLRLVRHLEGEPVDLRVHERSEGAAGEQRVAKQKGGGGAGERIWGSVETGACIGSSYVYRWLMHSVRMYFASTRASATRPAMAMPT